MTVVSCRALGVPVTDYTFEDCQLALAEGQLRLPEGHLPSGIRQAGEKPGVSVWFCFRLPVWSGLHWAVDGAGV